MKVNNAGFVLGVERVGDISDSDIDGMFSTNVLGLIAMTQLLVKRKLFPTDNSWFIHSPSDFKERNKGHIINLGSIAGIEPYAGGSIYCATKHAWAFIFHVWVLLDILFMIG